MFKSCISRENPQILNYAGIVILIKHDIDVIKFVYISSYKFLTRRAKISARIVQNDNDK